MYSDIQPITAVEKNAISAVKHVLKTLQHR